MIKRFNPDFSLSISHELAYMRETPEGGYVAHGDYATLFSELESVRAERDTLLAEIIAMKGTLIGEKYLDFIKQNNWNPAVKTVNDNFSGFMDPEVDFGSMVYSFAKWLIDTVATPATDAALAAIEARGVEKFAESQKEYVRLHRAELDPMTRAAYCGSAVDAERYAKQLREAK
ncbi:hypothetical protein [Serratia inhibens]